MYAVKEFTEIEFMKHIKLIACLLLGSTGFLQAQYSELDIAKFNSLYKIILENYADTVNSTKLIDGAIVKMLESLDPHSTYITAKDVQKANEPLVGNFEGIGVQYDVIKDTMYVVEVIAGGPCSYVGVMAGDKLIKINDTSCIGWARDEFMKKLRGAKDTKVNLTFIRAGKVIDFVVARGVIPLYSVDATYMLDSITGYIKLSRFAARTGEEVQKAIYTLQSKGMKNLVFDLQNNQGGYLNSAISISDDFLDENRLIVYTQGEHSPRTDFHSTGQGMFSKGKLIVLVNESSASASEIVSGAMQDWDRALIVGRRSFGKGLVQKPFYLSDGSVVRLTTAHYYTPSGRDIQKPYNEGKDAYYSELVKRLKSGQMMHPDTIKMPDSLMRMTAHGRKVFSGGGISPDIFVAIDTSFASEYYSNIVRKGLLSQFTLSYLDKMRKDLIQNYPNIQEFKMKFKVSEALVLEFTNFCEKNSLPLDKKGFKTAKHVIEVQIKALFARNLYSSAAYYEIANELDPAINKALELIYTNFAKYGVQN